MKPLPLLLLVFLALVGCASPTLEERIVSSEAYAGWPPEVRTAVDRGDIATGFTPEQVRVAWGEPDHISLERSAEGETEVWTWTRAKPSFGIGLGGGSFGSNTGVSGGVGVSTGGGREVLAQVRFRDGAVVSFTRSTGN